MPKALLRALVEDRRLQGLAMAATAYIAWGLLSPGNAILLREIGPLWMQASRATMALSLLLLWRRRAVIEAARKLHSLHLMVALWLGTVAAFLLFTVSQTRIAPAHTTLGFLTAPLWTALVVGVSGGGRPRRAFFPAALAMIVGGAMIVGARAGPVDPVGLLLAVGSGLAWAIYGVMLGRHTSIDWKDLLVASILVAAPMFWLVALFWEPAPAWGALSGGFWVWSLIQVVVPTLFSIGLYQASLARIGATSANLFVGLELVGAVVWSWILLGIAPGIWGAVGVAVVVAAVTWYMRQAR